MIKKIYIIILVLFGLAGLVYVIQLGLKAKPIIKINWTHFNTESEIANAIHMRLHQETKDHAIVFLGVDPDNKNHLKIWQNWILLNNEPEWKFDEIFIEPELAFRNALWPEAKTFDVIKEHDRFSQYVRDQIKDHHRIAIVVPNIYSSQLIMDNPVQRIMRDSQQRILYISLVTLDNTSLPCAAEGADYTGQSALGCIVQKKLFFVNRKKRPTNNFLWSATLEQYGSDDFLMFIKNSPGL